LLGRVYCTGLDGHYTCNRPEELINVNKIHVGITQGKVHVGDEGCEREYY
jgi:hypothetical protein